MTATGFDEIDPFDLPDWVGVDEVTWHPADGLGGGLVAGRITSEDRPDRELACDLLAADVAHPTALVPEAVRVEVHRTWQRDEVALLSHEGRLTVAAPGTTTSADQALEMLRRLAKAVGARPERFAARLYLHR